MNNPFDISTSEKPVLSSGLNVITILTIIGSVVSLLSSVWTFISAKKSYESLRATMESGSLDNAPKWVRGMLTPEMLETTRKMLENKFPLLIVGVLGSLLCLYGALEMRKFKKQGYMLWLVGEILPMIVLFLLIGSNAFAGWSLISLLFPIIFIILYTLYKKELLF